MTINLALNLAILLVCVQVYLRTQLSNILSKVVMCLSALWICQKTFDRVNYWKLFVKLLHDKVNVDIVRLLSYWYIQQEVCVQWHNTVSAPFNTGNGVRQPECCHHRCFADILMTYV